MQILVLVSVLALLLGCGPIGAMAGGELSGEIQPAPSEWAFTDQTKTVQLETRPDDPYSVNVWGVSLGSDFYVAAGQSSSTWAAHIADDDRVRLRVHKTIYELRAERDDSQAGRERFLAAAKAKYDFEPDPEQARDAILFRLVRR